MCSLCAGVIPQWKKNMSKPKLIKGKNPSKELLEMAFLYCYGTQSEISAQEEPVSLVDVQDSPLKSLKMCSCIFARTQFSMLPGPVSSNVLLTRLKEQRPENNSQRVLLNTSTFLLVLRTQFMLPYLSCLSLSPIVMLGSHRKHARCDSEATSAVIPWWISHYQICCVFRVMTYYTTHRQWRHFPIWDINHSRSSLIFAGFRSPRNSLIKAFMKGRQGDQSHCKKHKGAVGWCTWRPLLGFSSSREQKMSSCAFTKYHGRLSFPESRSWTRGQFSEAK